MNEWFSNRLKSFVFLSDKKTYRAISLIRDAEQRSKFVQSCQMSFKLAAGLLMEYQKHENVSSIVELCAKASHHADSRQEKFNFGELREGFRQSPFRIPKAPLAASSA